MGIEEVRARCASANLASRAAIVAAGFTWRERVERAEELNGEWIDHEVYSATLKK
jgi:RimJ/RimL family protein N-acetyltransferase